jgi:hypothetical protein
MNGIRPEHDRQVTRLGFITVEDLYDDFTPFRIAARTLTVSMLESDNAQDFPVCAPYADNMVYKRVKKPLAR